MKKYIDKMCHCISRNFDLSKANCHSVTAYACAKYIQTYPKLFKTFENVLNSIAWRPTRRNLLLFVSDV